MLKSTILTIDIVFEVVYNNNMETLMIWILGLIAFGVFVYFVPYKNIKNIQELQKQGLMKLDRIINLLEKDKWNPGVSRDKQGYLPDHPEYKK